MNSEVNVVSVVIPTLNRRQRLLRTLETIRYQTYPHLQIIVSNDGGTDGTVEAIAELQDNRIKVVSSLEPTGVSNARNRGIACATGQWVAFCDDDDFWVSTKIEDQLEAMITSSALWSFCSAIHVDDGFGYCGSNSSDPAPDARKLLWEANRVPGGCSNVVAHSSLLKKVGGFDPTLRVFADWDMWFRLSKVAKPVKVNSVRVLYAFHNDQMTADCNGLLSELAAFRNKHAGIEDPNPVPDPALWWIIEKAWLVRDIRVLIAACFRKPLLKHLLKALRVIKRARKNPRSSRVSASTEAAVVIEDVVSRIKCAEASQKNRLEHQCR